MRPSRKRPAAADDASARESATRELKRRPAALPTFLVMVAFFAVTFEFLVMRLESGHDPAVKATASSTPPKALPRKKIIITTVVSSGSGPAGGTTSSSSGSVAASPAPVATSTS